MREIKFKAKNLNGEWVYGYYWSADNKYYISNSIGFGYRVINNDTEIDPNTICQYIGIKDKNGTEIYEHDKVWNNYFKKYGIIEWDKKFAMFVVSFGDQTVYITPSELSVVGTKFDEVKEDE